MRSASSSESSVIVTGACSPWPGRLEPSEEVVALVVDDDEGRDVLDFDAPDRLHAELGIFHDLDLADEVLRKARGRAADRAQIEAAMLLAGLGDLA
jgi:hypothetical protein